MTIVERPEANSSMKSRHLRQHVCPKCRSQRLSLAAAAGPADSDEIEEGSIRCETCGAEYAVVRGLPRFVPPTNYAESFGFQWNLHAQTQLDSHSKLPISAERLWTAIGTRSRLDGQRVLEAGSGAGRFTEVLLAAGADVTTFDYSSAVDANARNQGRVPRLHLFQGDIFNIPLAESQFDKVICLGVLQHTPDPAAAFRSLARYVAPNGQLVVDVYRKSLAALMQWKYVLRPFTKRMKKESLYRLIASVTPALIPAARSLRGAAGRAGARLVPIVEYSYLGLEPTLNEKWAVLDTFDMYSPAHDHPQSAATLESWFAEVGFVDVDVRNGLNGVVGTGRRP